MHRMNLRVKVVSFVFYEIPAFESRTKYMEVNDEIPKDSQKL